MPSESLKIGPGVVTSETPALNEMSISVSNLIRFNYDRNGLGLPEKLGGWQKFFPSQMPAAVRALAAWEDTNAQTHLAVGTQNASGSTTLGVITNGALATITPRVSSDSITPAASTTAASPLVTITDSVTTGITSYDAVYIKTHISVGGLILFGLYEAITLTNTAYEISAIDQYGAPLPAPSTSSVAAVASFTTTNASNSVSVTLANHGYGVGSTYPVLVSTVVGGVTLYGNYIVQSVTSANVFVINAATQATSGATGSINGGNVAITYSYGVGATPPFSGYGINGYGTGGYGVGTAIAPSTGSPITASDWTMDNWGQILIACPINGTIFQPIYQFDPTSGNPTATVIQQGPPISDGIFVAMPERQIVAWGTTVTGIQDPLLIRWCDINNYGVWIGTATNQAGQWRISRGSRIVAGMQGPQQGLIWTDLDLWTMNYLGGETVYGFVIAGENCGLIGRKAMGTLGETVYWMGLSQFFMLTSTGVELLPCSVWDFVFQQIDNTNTSKIRCAVNSRFNEISWYFPTTSSGGEVAAYVKYNILMQCWDYGYLARSAWIDQSVLGPPIGADPNLLYIYQHETSPDADGAPLMASFQTGYAAISEGDFITFIDRIWPDMKWGDFGGSPSATVQITFYVANYPGDTPQVFGPYSVTQATEFFNPRMRGRLISIQISSSDLGSFWRLGNIRYRGKPDGKTEN